MKKNCHNNPLVWFLFNCLRPIPAKIFGAVSFLYWRHKAKKSPETFRKNEQAWSQVTDTVKLLNFFRNNYSYKYDRFGGFWDHDSSIYEWLMAFGDCDDAAYYAKKKLQSFGIAAKRIGIIFIKDCKLNLHFDTVYELDGITYLFNYGYPLSGDNMEEAINRFKTKWSASSVKYATVWY